ncbi:cation diffusion facilitator family transporter [Spirulina sp. 06S082]|uniref:cation diffusion facilitator family transporter n=1 Tax=Spirulina sp. 06S082 TaxID=3110248 RepID=UPI002B1EC117|nr:cation diffusion facilitator family transporter [Spirulina sp. 06S082]MEA5468105.1 cation diffusion facilitator family transporter [Spirulina sp. 06S082]
MGKKTRLLQFALLLLSCFFVAELLAATLSHSLSLVADAGHVFSDIAALGVTLTATWLTSRFEEKGVRSPTNCTPSKIEAIAALVNGLSLLGVAIWVGWEAILRLNSPHPEVQGLPMLLLAILGLIVNSINAMGLYRCSCGDLNLKSAFFHVIADVVSSFGVILAAIAVIWLHWFWADGVVSLLVCGAIALLALPLLVQSLQRLFSAEIESFSPVCDRDREAIEQLFYPSLKDVLDKQK